NATVFVVFAEAALGTLKHADHLIVDTVDHHVFADGGNAREENRRDVLSEHYNFLPVDVVAFADKAAGENRGIRIDLAVVRLHNVIVDRRDLAGPRADGVGLLPPHEVDRDIFHRRAAVLDGLGVFLGQWLAQALF